MCNGPTPPGTEATAPDREPAGPPQAATTTPGGDILVVDDDNNNLLAMEVALGELAPRMVKARSGAEALRRLLEADYAVVLLDVQMPNIDGFETANLIRTRARCRHLPIIFVTAFNQDDREIQRGYELGAVDFLFKPIVPEVIKAKVQVFIDLRERTAEVARQAERLRRLERDAADRRLAEARHDWESELLRRQNQQLEEADRRKDEFIAMLAHELRNPLSPLTASLELFNLSDLRDPTLAQARAVMHRQLRHLTRLIDDLLDVSRISQRKLALSPQPIDVATAVADAIETCRLGLEREQHTLTIDAPDPPVVIEADPVRVTQVLANLLNNAARYTDPGGQIGIDWRKHGEHLQLRVTDNGRGIEPNLRSRIFDMFVQARDGGHGLGLGLTLVKQLVELHGGSVEAKSEGRDQGSEFIVRLPLVSRATPAPPEQPDPTAARSVAAPFERAGTSFDRDGAPVDLRPLRIVLVDDDDDIRAMVEALLTRWGHQVATASSGPAGLELIVDSQPDVAILDIGLPGFDGHTLAQRIRAQTGPEKPKLVAVSGYGQTHDRQRARDAGFDAFLVKPAAADDLHRVLRRFA